MFMIKCPSLCIKYFFPLGYYWYIDHTIYGIFDFRTAVFNIILEVSAWLSTDVHLRDWKDQFARLIYNVSGLQSVCGFISASFDLFVFWWPTDGSKSSMTVISARQVELLTFGQKNTQQTVLIQLSLSQTRSEKIETVMRLEEAVMPMRSSTI